MQNGVWDKHNVTFTPTIVVNGGAILSLTTAVAQDCHIHIIYAVGDRPNQYKKVDSQHHVYIKCFHLKKKELVEHILLHIATMINYNMCIEDFTF